MTSLKQLHLVNGINERMVQAIAGYETCQIGQTVIRYDDHARATMVTLRGRTIAIVPRDGPITISLCGHDTALARSRVNAILANFMPLGWRVFKWGNLTYLIRAHDPGRWFPLPLNAAVTIAQTGQLMHVRL